ncbi:acetolactate synthase large subunit [Ferroplasma acidiphilum]|uniref:Acetolactate synthase n=4 Tax=Ferroplasma acidiphilum TaxID=74969 RepID=A0A7K4FNZ1_9ARCH|nr:acetolactate synthase large subunit [Candidatus Thermoplasmatota archaeon]NOL59807.1 acetolactate synthase large subunit [Ferroplasma acidiphilum]
MLIGSKLLVDSLKREGTKSIFGIPGLYNMPMYDSLIEDIESGELRHILMRHEQAAAHAADGYARATGNVGVCTATAGPGVTNIVTGLITAYQDSSPVVAITGAVNRNAMGKLSFQESDTLGVSFPVTKYAVEVKTIEEIPVWVRNAFYIASTGRPGPVVVDIPRDIQMENIEKVEEPGKVNVHYKPFGTVINMDKVREMATNLLKAEKPVILVGNGVTWANATEEVLKLSEFLGCPVVSTLPGKSAVPADYPLYVGAMGYYGRAEASMVALESDLLLAIGARFSDRTFTSYEEMNDTKKIFMAINLDPTDFTKGIKPDVSMAGNAKVLVNELLKALSKMSRNGTRYAWNRRINELKEYYSQFSHPPDDGHMRPWKILKTLRESLPRDAILTTGVGQHQMWAETHWENLEPRSFFSSTGMGTMGFGLPCAIGAKVGKPEKVVVDYDGDGSFMMTGNNLATAVDENIPVIAVVNDNRTLGLVRQVQDMFQSKRIVGVDYGNSPDILKYAESFGADAFDANNYSDISEFIGKAIRDNVPAVIRVPVDKEELALPTLPPGGKLREVIVSDPRKGNKNPGRL